MAAPTSDEMNLSPTQKSDLMGKLMRDFQRAQALGLIPEDGAQISERGQFIVSPSNIEEIEDKKMRRYRHKEYPKMLHAWPAGEETPLELVVNNKAEEEKAAALGWSADPVHGPGGRLGVEQKADEPTIETVREFAAPGQRQPFEQAPPPSPAKPKATKGKPGRPRKQKVN